MPSERNTRQGEPQLRRAKNRAPLLRRTSDRTPLGAVIGGIEYAVGTGDYELAAELLERDPIGAWFGLSPEYFGEVLVALAEAGVPGNAFVHAMSGLLLSEGGAGSGAPEADADTDPDAPTEAPVEANTEAPAQETGKARAEDRSFAVATLARRLFELRLEGRSREALGLSIELERRFDELEPVFDRNGGWSLFSAVQLGLTAMLAGDFSQAMASFTHARMHVMVPRLAFLTRDACAKSALIEALYGDAAHARALLDEADGIPRTESWAELGIDAACTIAAALAREQDPGSALRMIESVPMREVGEIWPFYAAALHRALLATGDLEEASHRLSMLEGLPLPRIDGEGFAGSALLLAGAVNALARGDLVGARERIERADDSVVTTRVLAALLELAAGRPRESLRCATGLHEQTRGLRTLEIWRLSTMAGSHLALGAEDECQEVIEFVLASPGGLSPREAQYFPAEVRSLAEARFEAWPRGGDEGGPGIDLFPMHREVLTSRELEVLADLARGRSREEIARAQFISMNTLKAHLRSVYRKLGVNSRTAAVLEAERRGIV